MLNIGLASKNSMQFYAFLCTKLFINLIFSNIKKQKGRELFFTTSLLYKILYLWGLL